MQEIRAVKVIVKPQNYNGDLEFDLVFDDNCVKSYRYDTYELRSFRMAERDLYENLAADYYEQLYGNRPTIKLIFY